MKKTVTVNLGGTVFHIDEDAYQLLDKYLTNLRIHFRREEGSDEIMSDFESRISELFNERLRLGYEVISIEQVEEVIRRMGKPEEIFDEEHETDSSNIHTDTEAAHVNVKKRLMRDPDNRIIGGVCGGLSAYMGWDATAIRLIFFLLIFLHGVIIPIYLLCWIIMPQARTATEKLQMRGESITVENIGRTVTDGFEKTADETHREEKQRSTFQKIADVFVQIVGILLKVFVVLIGVALIPVLLVILFIFVIVMLSLFLGSTSFLYHLSPFGLDLLNGHITTGMAAFGSLSTFLVIGIPVAALVYMACCHIFHWRPMPSGAKWVLLILWFIAAAFFAVYLIHYGYLWWGEGGPTWFWEQAFWP